jgi:biotin carboxyl carrier protein
MMTYIVTSRGQTRRVEVREERGILTVRLDNRELPVDVLQVGLGHYSLLLDGRSYEIDILPLDEGTVVLVNGQPFRVEIRRDQAPEVKARRETPGAAASERAVVAPMPGKVIKLLVKPGESVEAGRGVVVIEAMKMENELKAPKAGTVTEIITKEGATVENGAPLVVVE